MTQVESHRSGCNARKEYSQRFLIPAFLIVQIVADWAGDESKDEDPLRFSHSKEIRKCFFEKAH